MKFNISNGTSSNTRVYVSARFASSEPPAQAPLAPIVNPRNVIRHRLLACEA